MARKKDIGKESGVENNLESSSANEVEVETTPHDIEIIEDIEEKTEESTEEETKKTKKKARKDVVEQVTQEMESRIREIQAKLINLNTSLVFAIATSECKMRDRCEVFKYGREIAKVIKELQDLVKIRPRK